MHETILEHRLGDGAGAFGDGIQRRELGLHIRRKGRIGRGAQVDRFGTLSMHVQTHPILAGIDVGPRLFQFQQDRVEEIRTGVLEHDPAGGNGPRHQIRAGFDPVRQNTVTGPVETLYTLDGQGVRTGPFDLRAHGVEAIGQIRHFRLMGRIFDHRFPVRQGGGHHQVLRTGHRHHIQHQARAFEAVPGDPRLDVTLLYPNLRPQGLQALDMQIHGPRTDGATAGQRHIGAAMAGQQGPEHQDGRAHRLDQIVRREILLDGLRLDDDVHLLVHHEPDAHTAQQFHGGGHIVQMRNVAHRHHAIRKQRRGHDRQHRILGTGNADGAVQRNAAVND